MAKQLWLLRHGDAEPHGARTDSQRQLTERGRRQSDIAGRALERLGVRLSGVLSSPRERALETARISGGHLELEPDVYAPLSNDFDGGQARVLMGGLGDGEALMVVGHEPDFSRTVHDLTGARIDLKKGGAALVRFEGSQIELAVLLRPRDLDAIAHSSENATG